MSRRPPPPVLPFTGTTTPAVEVQRLDAAHPVAAFSHHAHRFHELLLLSAGGGTHRIGSEEHALRPGDLHLVGAGTPHALRLEPGAAGVLVLFEGDALDRDRAATIAVLGDPLLHAFTANTTVRLDAAAAAALLERIGQLDRELAGERPHRNAGVAALMRLLLIDVARVAAPVATPPADGRVAEALAVIDQRFRQPLSLADVARCVHRDPSRLTAAVREATGRTVQQWIEERRMAEARRELRHTERTVAEIAERSGFPDPGYFARRFAVVHGVAPGRWREMEKGAPIVP